MGHSGFPTHLGGHFSQVAIDAPVACWWSGHCRERFFSAFPRHVPPCDWHPPCYRKLGAGLSGSCAPLHPQVYTRLNYLSSVLRNHVEGGSGMTRESPTSNPASDMDGLDGMDEPRRSGARATSAPARIVTGKRILPPGSSDKYPLPGRWPEPDDGEDVPEPEAVEQAAPPPPPPPPVVDVVIETSAPGLAPVVRRANWLKAPDYWLADHQTVPRPPTRPLPRPRRFVRMSRGRSAALFLVAVVGIGVVVAGMLFSGHLTYEFFNTPMALPTAHPATATATDTPVVPTATDIPTPNATANATSTQGAVTPGVTPNATPGAPNVTP